MLAAALLIPLSMRFCGELLLRRPPEDINSAYGYRTERSMRSQDAWAFAQTFCGRFWVRTSRPVLAASIIWMLPLWGQEIGGMSSAVLLLLALQMIPFLAVLPITEGALRREFNQYGRKR